MTGHESEQRLGSSTSNSWNMSHKSQRHVVFYVVKSVFFQSKTFCLWDIIVIEVRKQSEMQISLSLRDHIQMEKLLIAWKSSMSMWFRSCVKAKVFVCFTTTTAKLSPDLASRASVVFTPSSLRLQLFPHLSSLLILSCLFSSYHFIRIFQEPCPAVTCLMNCNELLSWTNMHRPTLKKKKKQNWVQPPSSSSQLHGILYHFTVLFQF